MAFENGIFSPFNCNEKIGEIKKQNKCKNKGSVFVFSRNKLFVTVARISTI